ncbi:YSIRK-type signal peptide-containing protein [Staphylococcus gallinarum]
MTVGTASLLIGATLLFGVNNDAQAAEDTTSEATTESQSGKQIQIQLKHNQKN